LDVYITSIVVCCLKKVITYKVIDYKFIYSYRYKVSIVYNKLYKVYNLDSFINMMSHRYIISIAFFLVCKEYRWRWYTKLYQ